MKGLLLFIGGVAAGAAFTALYTPYRGEELRARIRRILIEKSIVASENIDDLVEQVVLELEEEEKL